MGVRTFEHALLASVALAGFVIASPAVAQNAGRQRYSIGAQDLGDALRTLGRQSGKEIAFDAAIVARKRSNALKGDFTLDEAIARLLAGTGLHAEIDAGGILIRGREAASGPVTDGSTGEESEILVTGSRIRGAIITSPVIKATGEEIQKAGMNDLGSFMRSLPQNFSGGQNPTVAGGGSQGNNENTTSSSTLNLRGLGADATLTLLNGHRMPYDGVFQGVDIASIPLSAIDRLEIVTDGASAIYGSDAVAGVANVMLKQSFSGLEASARYGWSTDGGNDQQQFGLVGGAEWQTGGVMAVADYGRQGAILAGQRDYARTLDGSQTLVPELRQYSGIITAHQRIASSITLGIDGTYSHRESEIASPSSTTADYLANGGLIETAVDAYSVSPAVRIDLSPGWQAYVMGTYGVSRAALENRFFLGGAAYFEAWSDYNNKLETIETGATGTLLRLPGGALKLAVGGGYRSNELDLFTRSLSGGVARVSADFTRGRDSWFGFAELSAPLVGPQSRIALIHRLGLTAALRYEDYPGIGRVATPKVGLLYAPTASVDLKISWGKSFKAPTLYQEFQYKFVALRLASAYGTNGFPAGSTVLQMSGGNPGALEPEHADNLTLSAAFEPTFAPGLRLELSHFRVRYRDRIRQPITSALGVFGNPNYAGFVTLSPTSAQIEAALSNAPAGLSNFSGTPYNPARVVAIIDNRQHNTARQEISGIDASVRYTVAAGTGLFTTLADASYLRSRQILVAGQAATDLAGTIYNAPHWRARGGMGWDNDRFSLTTYGNFIGGTRDVRATPAVPVASMTTWDAALTYKNEADGSAFDGTAITFSVLNLLNAAPGRIRQSFPIEPPYDSANYAPIGRFISLSIRKNW